MLRGKLFKTVLSVAFVLSVFGLLTPATANAQVTIYHVRVTISHSTGLPWVATYCDDEGTTCLSPIWNFPATGVALGAGQTLVLTQSGTIPISATQVGGNFDTSEAIKPAAPPTPATTLRDCSPTDPCTTRVEVDTTNNGIVDFGNIYNGVADPLDNKNQDTGGTLHKEYNPYEAPVIDTAAYTLQLGYADNVHGCPLPGGCLTLPLPAGNGLPTPFNGLLGTAVATVFLGGPNTGTAFDAGALLFTAKQQSQGCTFTIGFWKTHGPIPKGNNSNEWPVNALTLGTVNYTGLQLLSILNQPVEGNGLVSLAHQLIGAKLNVLSGATSPTIAATIAAADALIGNRVVPPVGSGFLDPSTTSALNTALTNFNEGLAGPPHCD